MQMSGRIHSLTLTTRYQQQVRNGKGGMTNHLISSLFLDSAQMTIVQPGTKYFRFFSSSVNQVLASLSSLFACCCCRLPVQDRNVNTVRSAVLHMAITLASL